MLELHRASDRGSSHLDWLDSRHSFSFADWYDPGRMGFRSLRVLNDDQVAPGAGFGAHPHREMEILTVVLEGALEHRDRSGTRTILHAGDVQHMSAGRGVVHSEWNASETEPVHFLQVWLHPARAGVTPSHAVARSMFPVEEGARAGRLRALATNLDVEDALEIQQDARVFAGRAGANEPVHHDLASGRGAWVQVVHGSLIANGTPMAAGDGLGIEDEQSVVLSGDPDGDFLLFDLA